MVVVAAAAVEEEEDTADLQLGKASFTKIHLLVDPVVAARVRSVT